MNFRPGYLSVADAQRLNEMYRELERWRRLSVAAPLQLNRGAGTVNLSLGQLTPSSVSAWKEPVRVATAAAGTLASAFAAGQVVDGVTLVAGDRILVKDQSDQRENGIYRVQTSGAPTRAPDADVGRELVGAAVVVLVGATNADTVWLCTTDPAVTLGSSSVVWSKIAPSTSTSAWKEPVRAATVAALPANTYANGSSGAGATLTGTSNGAIPTMDGVTLAAGDAVLVKDEANTTRNGIYTVTQLGSGSLPYVLTRRTDADTGAKLLAATVVVQAGTVNADSEWLSTANAPITVGTTFLAWAQKAFGPNASTNNAVARYDGTSGKQLKNSAVTISDTGAVAAPDNVTISGASSRSLSVSSGSVALATLTAGAGGSASLQLMALPAVGGTGVLTMSIHSATEMYLALNPSMNFTLRGNGTSTVNYAVTRGSGIPGDPYVDRVGVNMTCTVKVGGVDKTMTITGGIVTDIS